MKREIGSSFYSLEPDDNEYGVLTQSEISLPERLRLYYSGRSAFFSLLEDIHRDHAINKIWLPAYYCHNVLNFLKRNYNSIHYYYINPFEPNRAFKFQRFAKKGDIIVLNNFWGLFNYDYDEKSQDRPIIIEDHSHGWLSKQCLNSKADYCMASVRKSYPVAGGGVAWIPNRSKSPTYENTVDETIEDAYITLQQSINKKRQFLKSGDGTKEGYLNLLYAGESLITASNSYIEPNEPLRQALTDYIKYDPNVIKSKHLALIFKYLAPSKHFKIIRRKGYTPFGLLLLFKEKAVFDEFKAYCIANYIYPANLWPSNDLRSKWKYFFNIHTDFRYDGEDMKYLIQVLNSWIYRNG
ncbi:MAG: hypothetical protein KJO00_02660 [Bacteroidia bacterium]|nr:hypothetical protein [Bacteroidia bacterium]